MANKQSNQPLGWICPQCGRSLAPWVNQCPFCVVDAERPPLPDPWRPRRKRPIPYKEPWEPWEEPYEQPYDDIPSSPCKKKREWDDPIIRMSENDNTFHDGHINLCTLN